MASWIVTRVFYAIVFFMFGAWVASVSPGMKGVMGKVSEQVSEIGSQGFEKLRGWTLSTLTPPVETSARPKEAVAPPALVGQSLLVNARAAFARKDIVGAINAYRDYIDRNPGDVDARGELGNVYFANGRLRDAAHIYDEAANMKLDGGDAEGARPSRARFARATPPWRTISTGASPAARRARK